MYYIAIVVFLNYSAGIDQNGAAQTNELLRFSLRGQSKILKQATK